VANGIGVIDQDYCGSEDEIKCIAYNFTQETVKVVKGERLVQGILVKVATPQIVLQAKTALKSRGGIGSTG
jgi:dUTP pyrophosphatase